MRVLVTGGSGFIGTNLVEHFVARGDEVCNFDIAPPRNSSHFSLWRKGDLLEAHGLCALVHDFDPEVVFHMAARTDLAGRSIADYSANTVGVKNLIAAMGGSTSLRRLVFASSRLVCRIGYEPINELDYCPTTPYGESKVIGEQIVREAFSRLPCPSLIVRPTSIWGPWFDVPYKNFFLTIARGRYVHPNLAQIPKSFGFVGNSVHQLDRIINAPSDSVAGKTFYLADYPPVDVISMANAIQREFEVKRIKTLSVPTLQAIAWIGDALKIAGWRDPPLTSFRLNNLLTPMVHDIGSLQALVGSLPFSMTDGVRITVNWLRRQPAAS